MSHLLLSGTQYPSSHRPALHDAMLTPPRIPNLIHAPESMQNASRSPGIHSLPHLETPPALSLSGMSLNTSNNMIAELSFSSPTATMHIGESEDATQRDISGMPHGTHVLAAQRNGATVSNVDVHTQSLVSEKPRKNTPMRPSNAVPSIFSIPSQSIPQPAFDENKEQLDEQFSQTQNSLAAILDYDFEDGDSDSDYSANDVIMEDDSDQELFFRPQSPDADASNQTTFTTPTQSAPLQNDLLPSSQNATTISQSGTEEINQMMQQEGNFFLSPIESSELTFLQYDVFKMDFITNNLTDDHESEDDEFVATHSDADDDDLMDIIVPEDELRQLEGEMTENTATTTDSSVSTRRSPRIPRTSPQNTNDQHTTTSAAPLPPSPTVQSTPERVGVSLLFSSPAPNTPPIVTSSEGADEDVSEAFPNPKFSADTPLHVTLKSQFYTHFQLLLTNYLIACRDRKSIDVIQELLINLYEFRNNPFIPENFRRAWDKIHTFLEMCNPDNMPGSHLRKTKNQFLWECIKVFNTSLDRKIFGIIDEDIKGVRTIFLPAEDRLLAHGIELYGNDFAKIAETLLPGKKEEQVLNRVRNVTAKRPKDNPIFLTLERKKEKDKKKILKGVRLYGEDFRKINSYLFGNTENARILSILYKEIDDESKEEAKAAYKVRMDKQLERMKQRQSQNQEEQKLKALLAEKVARTAEEKKEDNQQRMLKQEGDGSRRPVVVVEKNELGLPILPPPRRLIPALSVPPGVSDLSRQAPQIIASRSGLHLVAPPPGLPAILPGNVTLVAAITAPILHPKTPQKMLHESSTTDATPARDDISAVINFAPDMPTPPQDGAAFWTPPTNGSRKRIRPAEFFSHSGKKRRHVDTSPGLLKSPLVTPIPAEMVMTPPMAGESGSSSTQSRALRYPIARDVFHVEYLDMPPIRKRQLFPTPQKEITPEKAEEPAKDVANPQSSVLTALSALTSLHFDATKQLVQQPMSSSETPDKVESTPHVTQDAASAPPTSTSPATTTSQPWTKDEQVYLLRCLKVYGTEPGTLESRWDIDRKEGKITRSNRELMELSTEMLFKISQKKKNRTPQ